MKTPFAGFAALALTGFALSTTGCVTEYQTVSPAPTYVRTSLPAASRVALVMEFKGGEPTPEERAEVRALLADYLSGKGSVLVDDPDSADYLVHVVLERRNPDNPSEWTVVNTYSARSLGADSGDEYLWPSGIIEDDYYETTTFSYIGFGVFYPVWFDLWSSPWHRGRVIVCPPPRSHHRYWETQWRTERRWHRPDRWHGHRRPDGPRETPHRPDPRPGGNNGGRDRDGRDRDWRHDGDRRPDTPNRESPRRGGGDRGGDWNRGDGPRHDTPSRPDSGRGGDHRGGGGRPGGGAGVEPPSGIVTPRPGSDLRPARPTPTPAPFVGPVRPSPASAPQPVARPPAPRAVAVPGHGIVPLRPSERSQPQLHPQPPQPSNEPRERVQHPRPQPTSPSIRPAPTPNRVTAPTVHEPRREQPRVETPHRRDDSGGARRSDPPPRTKDDSDDSERSRSDRRH